MRPTVLLPVLLSSLVAAKSAGQTSGTFVRASDMTMPRSQHTATLLQNGAVLIAGGAIGDLGATGVPSTEVFDPVTGTFMRAAGMSAARRMHSATLMPNGRVLIAGGYDDDRALRSAEVYDPASDTFMATGDMVWARGGHDAILLANGTVLMLGGNDGSWPAIPPAEIYDPATGTFAEAGPYAFGPWTCDFCAPSVLLTDGRVLFSWRSPAQLYDPISGTFSATGAPTQFESTATLLMNGQVLFTGGADDLGRSALAELYDPAIGAFTATGSMGMRHVGHTLTLLPDGTVMAAGGETDACSSTSCIFAGTVSSAEFYDPALGKFTWSGSMTTSRETHTATVLNDGRVLIAGGDAYGGIGLYYGPTQTAELYTPDSLIAAPALFSDTTAGQNGLVHAASGRPVSADDPAVADEVIALSCTGLNDGSVIPPRVAIGGRLADVVSVAPADSSGARVVQVRVPRGIASGAASLRLSYIGRWSNEWTIATR
jgi:hypothetical protein